MKNIENNKDAQEAKALLENLTKVTKDLITAKEAGLPLDDLIRKVEIEIERSDKYKERMG